MSWFGREKPYVDVTSIGNLLIEAGVCSRDQVEAAVAFQKDNPDAMMGEALVQMGAITRHQLEVALARQQIRRSNGSGKGVTKLAHLATERILQMTAKTEEFLAHETKKIAVK